MHPAILTEGGLRPAVKALARRTAVPVQLDLRLDDRLPEPVEVAAYYVIAEALANAARHSGATGIQVSASVPDGQLEVSVRDDGVGGAEPGRGRAWSGSPTGSRRWAGRSTWTAPPGRAPA
ncbi:sensor histidine kinase [Dactylosporangium cerinum]